MNDDIEVGDSDWNNSLTPPKTNIEPENTPLEKEKHLQTTSFWVPC